MERANGLSQSSDTESISKYDLHTSYIYAAMQSSSPLRKEEHENFNLIGKSLQGTFELSSEYALDTVSSLPSSELDYSHISVAEKDSLRQHFKLKNFHIPIKRLSHLRVKQLKKAMKKVSSFCDRKSMYLVENGCDNQRKYPEPIFKKYHKIKKKKKSSKDDRSCKHRKLKYYLKTKQVIKIKERHKKLLGSSHRSRDQKYHSMLSDSIKSLQELLEVTKEKVAPVIVLSGRDFDECEDEHMIKDSPRKRVKFLDESNKPEEEFLDSSTLLTELKSDDISIVPEELQVTDPVITKQDTPSDAPSEAPPKSSLPFYPFYLPDPILRDPSQRTTTFSILKKRNRKRIYIEKNSNQEYECKKKKQVSFIGLPPLRMEDDGDSVSLISDLETNEDIDTDMIAVAEDYNGDWKKKSANKRRQLRKLRKRRKHRENPRLRNRGCQTGKSADDNPLELTSQLVSDIYQRGRRGPVPITNVVTQTGEDNGAIPIKPKTTPTKGKVEVSGSVWLANEPLYLGLTSRCVPICTELYTVIQKKQLLSHDHAHSLNEAVGKPHNKPYGVDINVPRSPDPPPIIVDLPDKIINQCNQLQELYYELKQVDIEWPFWRHVSCLAIALENIASHLPSNLGKYVLRRESYKYRTTGVSTYILGSLIVELSDNLEGLLKSISTCKEEIPQIFKESVEMGFQMACYVRLYTGRGCREPMRFLDSYKCQKSNKSKSYMEAILAEEEENAEDKPFAAVLHECKERICQLEARIMDASENEKMVVSRVIDDFSASGLQSLKCPSRFYESSDKLSYSAVNASCSGNSLTNRNKNTANAIKRMCRTVSTRDIPVKSVMIGSTSSADTCDDSVDSIIVVDTTDDRVKGKIAANGTDNSTIATTTSNSSVTGSYGSSVTGRLGSSVTGRLGRSPFVTGSSVAVNSTVPTNSFKVGKTFSSSTTRDYRTPRPGPLSPDKLRVLIKERQVKPLSTNNIIPISSRSHLKTGRLNLSGGKSQFIDIENLMSMTTSSHSTLIKPQHVDTQVVAKHPLQALLEQNKDKPEEEVSSAPTQSQGLVTISNDQSSCGHLNKGQLNVSSGRNKFVDITSSVSSPQSLKPSKEDKEGETSTGLSVPCSQRLVTGSEQCRKLPVQPNILTKTKSSANVPHNIFDLTEDTPPTLPFKRTLTLPKIVTAVQSGPKNAASISLPKSLHSSENYSSPTSTRAGTKRPFLSGPKPSNVAVIANTLRSLSTLLSCKLADMGVEPDIKTFRKVISEYTELMKQEMSTSSSSSSSSSGVTTTTTSTTSGTSVPFCSSSESTNPSIYSTVLAALCSAIKVQNNILLSNIRQPILVKAQPSSVNVLPLSVKGQPSSANVLPSSVKAQLSSANVLPSSVKGQPSSANVLPSSVKAQPSSANVLPSSVKGQPSSTNLLPSSVKAQLSSANVLPLPVKGQPSSANVLPSSVKAQLSSANVLPLPVKGQPSSANVLPLPVKGQPSSANVLPSSVKAQLSSANVLPLPVKGQPSSANVLPSPVKGQPSSANVLPSSVKGQPSSANVLPSPVKAQLSSANVLPLPVKGQPSSANVLPSSVKGQPSSANVLPLPVKGQPSSANVLPSSVKGQPSSANLLPSSVKEQPSSVNVLPSSVKGQPSSANVLPSSVKAQLSSANVLSSPVKEQPSSVNVLPSSVKGQPSSANVLPSSVKAQLSSANVLPLPVKGQPSSANVLPSSVKGQPSSANLLPSSVKEQPSLVNVLPSSVKGQPSSANVFPLPVKAQPSSTNVLPLSVNMNHSSDHLQQHSIINVQHSSATVQHSFTNTQSFSANIQQLHSANIHRLGTVQPVSVNIPPCKIKLLSNPSLIIPPPLKSSPVQTTVYAEPVHPKPCVPLTAYAQPVYSPSIVSSSILPSPIMTTAQLLTGDQKPFPTLKSCDNEPIPDCIRPHFSSTYRHTQQSYQEHINYTSKPSTQVTNTITSNSSSKNQPSRISATTKGVTVPTTPTQTSVVSSSSVISPSTQNTSTKLLKSPAKLILQLSLEDNAARVNWTLPSDSLHLQDQIEHYEIRYAKLYHSSLFTVQGCRQASWCTLGLVPCLPLPMSVTLSNFQSNSHYVVVVIGKLQSGAYLFSDIKLIEMK